MIRIAIADDHQAFIDGLMLFFKYAEDISVVGTANNGQDLIELVKLKEPHIVIVDIGMPKLNGIEATKMIKDSYKHIKIIAFSMFDQVKAVQEMHASGANGYIIKTSPMEELIKAIYSVQKGNVYLDSRIDVSILDNLQKEPDSSKSLLTKSEKQIIRLIAQDKTSVEIAEIRFTAVSTVDKHRKNIMRKLNLKGSGSLVKYAKEQIYNFSL